MPRARSSRAPKHEAAVPIQRDGEDEDFQMTEDVGLDVEASDENPEDEPAEAPIFTTDDAAAAPGLAVHRKKKDKQRSKRDALMQRLRESAIPVSPYSKSHQRRQKRKEKQSLGLGSITAALEEAAPGVGEQDPTTHRPKTAELASMLEQEQQKLQKPVAQKKPTSPGKIGEDTVSRNLSSKQRQKMLAKEKERLPAILAHKAFAASPFETIRQHAANTVVPLERSKRPQRS